MDRQAGAKTQDTPRQATTPPDDRAEIPDNPAAAALRSRIIRDALPPPANTTRWVIRRKADVVKAVLNGVISLQEVCQRYDLSVEEFDSWHRLIERHGPAALRSTRLQEYRDASRRQRPENR